jgi:hypothetical protein
MTQGEEHQPGAQVLQSCASSSSLLLLSNGFIYWQTVQHRRVQGILVLLHLAGGGQ